MSIINNYFKLYNDYKIHYTINYKKSTVKCHLLKCYGKHSIRTTIKTNAMDLSIGY